MTDQITMVPVDLIDPGDNHRTVFDPDELAALGQSISVVGQIEPVVLRPDGDRYRLVAGERRWRAHQLIGKTEIKAMIRTSLTAEDVENIMLAENTGRVDLALLEEAEAYARQRAMGKTVDEIAAAAGVARFRVEWRLSLLDLCEVAKDAIRAGRITPAVALELRRLDPERQILGVKAWLANPAMGATAFQKRIVAKLLADQEAAEPLAFGFDWEEEARTVQPIKYTVAGLRKVVIAMADELVARGYPEDGPLVAEARNM